MDRRQFIKNAAMASAVVAGTGFAGYECSKPAKNIRWSMGWILWRDFKNANIPLAEAIKNMSDLKLDGVEYTPRKDELSKFGFTRESFRDLLAEKNLSIAGNYFGGNFHDPEKQDGILAAFKNTLENLKFYGAKNVVIGPPGRGNWSDPLHHTGDGNETGIPDKIRAMAPFLNELGKIAQDSGMEIGLHPHVNTIVENPVEIDMIMELTDPKYVGMAPDTGHIQLGGGDPLAIIKKYSNRLNYFHLKDVTGVFQRPNFGPNLRELGNGEVDFPGIMNVLKEIRYKGWLNVEQDHTDMTPEESATQSMKYINSKLGKIYG
ncbi:MAG: sugar phosphate isomerase/epimerase [Bacteroidales bacterium]|jgi:inosose dehydratase|nr:sugar phosphate isomerase/epimerase [Bacteroidales bacterium]